MSRFILSFCLVALSNITFSQSTKTLSDVLNASSITWTGIDFTDVALIETIERDGFNNPEKIRDYYFEEWNDMIFKEPDKYSLNNFFGKDQVDVEFEETIKANKEIKIQSAIHIGRKDKPSPLRTQDELQAIIDKYNYEGLTGIGATFIITEMNKEKSETIGYIVFIDFDTKKIIYSHKLVGGARGFGFRNYWLRSFYEMWDSINIYKWHKKQH